MFSRIVFVTVFAATLLLVLPSGLGQSVNTKPAGPASDPLLRVPRLGIQVKSTNTPGNYPATDGKIIAFHTDEAIANQDLNGDGKITQLMNVIQYYDIASGVVVNTMQEGLNPSVAKSANGFIAFCRSEINGQPVDYYDWNGDGDKQDSLIAYYDTATGLTTDTLIDGREPDIDGDRIAFFTYESSVGPLPGTDLNGDGDTQDPVIRCYVISTGALKNTMASGTDPSISGDKIAFSTWEAWCRNPITGAVEPFVPAVPDLNGDGNLTDYILRYHTISTGVTTFTTRDCSYPTIDGSNVAYSFYELDDDGPVDADFDGDTIDSVLQFFDIGTWVWTQPQLPLTSTPTVKGTVVAFDLEEIYLGYSMAPAHGTELNANAFPGDHIVCLYDMSTKTFTSTGVAGFAGSGDSLERNMVVYTDMYTSMVGYILF